MEVLNGTDRFHRAFWLVFMCLCGGLLRGADAEQPEATLNFAYATVLGTGAYQVGERSVYVLNLPFFVGLREPSESSWGIELLLPVTVGVHDFDLRDIVDEGLPERLETFGFTPGLEISIPMDDHWMLKPFGQVGYVTDLHEDNDAWTYIGGLKSLSSYPSEKLTISLGGSVTLAGQSAASGDDSSGFGLLSLGVDLRYPLGLQFQGRQLEGSLYLIGSRYFNQLEFLDIGDAAISIEHTVEIGVTLGTAEPFRLLGVDWQRVGVGFVYGDDLKAVSFNLGFPF